MPTAPAEAATRRPLRLWPGVVLVALQWLLRFVLPTIRPALTERGMLGSLVCGLLLLVWWTFFSRASRGERWGGAALMIAALAATPLVLHESLATAGMGMLFFIYAVPWLCLALVVWAVAARNLAPGARRATLVATILIACGGWALLRTEGITGTASSQLAWRWSATPEERLLARSAVEGMAPADTTAEITPDWPGFRGAERDGVVRGARIGADWSATPPVELWRRPVGPGWSSFAVGGGRLYTQEQRGEQEVVACYDLRTGEPLWQHGDTARFWEANAGAGPRATPTLSGGRLYTLGATGIVNALDAADGAVLWSRDAAADTGAKRPDWGFAGSPLVVGDLVVVATAGALIGYDRATGESRWLGPDGGDGYSSPHLMTLDGVDQIVQLSRSGVIGVAPADGSVLWEHPWGGYPIVQPAISGDGDLLLSVTSNSGLRRLAVARDAAGWSAAERWTSIRLKPYFNDFVVHRGHAYGFDGSILAAIDLANGARSWKGGRYGNGQLLLLPEQDLLLVLSEQGELALVAAAPDGFDELARFAALTGKTWNHPVIVDDLLLVRNDREMAAFRLPPAAG